VAYHLGHRAVSPFDFYCESGEIDPEAVEAELIGCGNVAVQSQSRGSLALILEGLPLRFVSHPFPLLGRWSRCSGLRVAGLLDASLDTILAVSGSGSMRDFVDLYCILKNGASLAGLVSRAAEKYHSISYPVYQMLRGIVWFRDAESDVPPKTTIAWKWQDVKELLRKEAKRLFSSSFETAPG
jgi:hypothetical protein